MMWMASLAVLAYLRISRKTITRGKLLSRGCGPGFTRGAHVISLRFIGQKPGAGSLFSCRDPNFLAKFYALASALFAFSDKRPLRHLSERLRFVTKTLLE